MENMAEMQVLGIITCTTSFFALHGAALAAHLQGPFTQVFVTMIPLWWLLCLAEEPAVTTCAHFVHQRMGSCVCNVERQLTQCLRKRPLQLEDVYISVLCRA